MHEALCWIGAALITIGLFASVVSLIWIFIWLFFKLVEWYNSNRGLVSVITGYVFLAGLLVLFFAPAVANIKRMICH